MSNTASPVDLTKLPMPYRCIECSAEGVKLWREYSVFLHHQTLKCRACSEKQAEVDYDGSYKGGSIDLVDGTDQIGLRIPAVPDTTGTFWGYTSVPDDAVAWWLSLPEKVAAG